MDGEIYVPSCLADLPALGGPWVAGALALARLAGDAENPEGRLQIVQGLLDLDENGEYSVLAQRLMQA